MGVVDTAVMGHVSAVGQAGAGLGNGLFFAVSVFGVGAILGVDPLIAQAIGAGSPRRARALLWQGVWSALVVAAGLLVVLCLLPLGLRHFGVPPEQAATARAFLAYRTPSIFPLLIFCAASAYLQAVGREVQMLVMTVVANVLNLGLDLWLVFGGLGIPAMGAGGSGLASTLCSMAEIVYLGFLVRSVPLEGPPSSVRPVWEEMRRIFRVGLPIGMYLTLESGVFTVAAVMASWLGAESAAAHQIVLTFASLSFTVALGLGIAGSVRVGYAVGARDTQGARRAGLTALIMGATFMASSGLFFALLRHPLVSLLSSQPRVEDVAMPLFLVAAAFQISDGLQCVGAGVLRGAGVSRFTFVANLLGHWGVGLPLALLFGFRWKLGVTGIWWGLCAGLSAVAVALVWKFLSVSSREMVPLESSP